MFVNQPYGVYLAEIINTGGSYMRNSARRILSLLMALIMIMSVSVSVLAEDALDGTDGVAVNPTQIRLNVSGDEDVYQEISANGSYTFNWEGSKDSAGDWLVLKCGTGNNEAASNFPVGTVVELTEFWLNGEDWFSKLSDDFTKTITIKADKKISFTFWNLYAGGDKVTEKPASLSSIKATIVVTLPEVIEEPEYVKPEKEIVASEGYKTEMILIQNGVAAYTGKEFIGEVGWNSVAFNNNDSAAVQQFLAAISTVGARFSLDYTVEGTDGAWFNMFGVNNNFSIPTYASDAGKMLWVLDGQANSQWNAMKIGSHQVYFDCAVWIDTYNASDKSTNGLLEDFVSLTFHADCNKGNGGRITVHSLSIEVPANPIPEIVLPVKGEEIYRLIKNRSANEATKDEYLARGIALDGWSPFITSYVDGTEMAAIKTAMQQANAFVEVISDGAVNEVVLQAGADYGYSGIGYNVKTTDTCNGLTVTYFDANAIVDNFTSRVYTGDAAKNGENYSMEDIMNFDLVGTTGAKVVSLRVVTIEPIPSYITTRPIITDTIKMQYVIAVPNGVNPDSILFNGMSAESSLLSEQEIAALGLTSDSKNVYYSFKLPEILPYEIDSAVICTYNGETIDLDGYDSVFAYCKNMLTQSTTSEKFKGVISSLLRYSESSQKYANGTSRFTADNIPGILPGNTESAWIDNSSNLSNAGGIKAASLVLNSNISIRFYLNNDADLATASISIDGVIVDESRIDRNAMGREGNCIEVTGFSPLDYNKAVQITTSDSVVTYSVAAYGARMKDKDDVKDILCDLYNYYAAATAFAG